MEWRAGPLCSGYIKMMNSSSTAVLPRPMLYQCYPTGKGPPANVPGSCPQRTVLQTTSHFLLMLLQLRCFLSDYLLLSSRLCLVYICIPSSALHLQSVFSQQRPCKCLWSRVEVGGVSVTGKGHRHVHFEFRDIVCPPARELAQLNLPDFSHKLNKESCVLLTSVSLLEEGVRFIKIH